VTTYRINAPHFCAAAIVEEDTVVQSAPILRWAVGRPWSRLRDYARQKGWVVEPLPSDHVAWIDAEEASYELKWIGNRCVRITRHVDGYEPEDVALGDLPEEIVNLIE
jgi:hypothetical protein